MTQLTFENRHLCSDFSHTIFVKRSLITPQSRSLCWQKPEHVVDVTCLAHGYGRTSYVVQQKYTFSDENGAWCY